MKISFCGNDVDLYNGESEDQWKRADAALQEERVLLSQTTSILLKQQQEFMTKMETVVGQHTQMLQSIVALLTTLTSSTLCPSSGDTQKAPLPSGHSASMQTLENDNEKSSGE